MMRVSVFFFFFLRSDLAKDFDSTISLTIEEIIEDF